MGLSKRQRSPGSPPGFPPGFRGHFGAKRAVARFSARFIARFLGGREERRLGWIPGGSEEMGYGKWLTFDHLLVGRR